MRWFKDFKEQLTWSANGRSFLDIDRGNFLRRIIIKLYGTLDLAAGSASGTARTCAPANVIRDIKVIGNDIGDIKHFDGSGLFLSTAMHNRVRFPVVVPAGGAAAAQTFLGVFTIDFVSPAKGNIRPIDTLLDTRRFSTLKLEIDWSANLRDALFSGNDRTESNAAAWAIVQCEYERPHANFGEPYLYMQYQSDKDVAVAGGNWPFPLDVDEVYKNIIIFAQNQAASGQYTGNNAVLASYDLRLNSNIYPFSGIDFTLHQYQNCLDLEWTSIIDGCNIHIFDKDHMHKEALSTVGGSSLKYVMTVTTPAGNNRISMYPGILRSWTRALRGEVCAPVARSSKPLTAGSTVQAMA